MKYTLVRKWLQRNEFVKCQRKSSLDTETWIKGAIRVTINRKPTNRLGYVKVFQNEEDTAGAAMYFGSCYTRTYESVAKRWSTEKYLRFIKARKIYEEIKKVGKI